MSELIKSQKRFYQEKFNQFGDSPLSLSYNDRESQNLRFEILCELFKFETGKNPFSVHEVGCGLAHFQSYLGDKQIPCEYSGSDICGDFVKQSKIKFPQAEFFLQDIANDLEEIPQPMKEKDYYVLSGTFNPIGQNPKKKWEKFLWKAISNMFRLCHKGIGFNGLTVYSDYQREDLYYADPKVLYDWCKRNLSRFVTLIEDRPLYEFTLFVYKKDFIKSLYPTQFDKYFQS